MNACRESAWGHPSIHRSAASCRTGRCGSFGTHGLLESAKTKVLELKSAAHPPAGVDLCFCLRAGFAVSAGAHGVLGGVYVCPSAISGAAACRSALLLRRRARDSMRFPPQVVMDVHTDGALVWVHNYHLLLLPSYLMRKVILARLGSALTRHGSARLGTDSARH